MAAVPKNIPVEWSAGFRKYMTSLRVYADGNPTGAHASLLQGLEKLSAKWVGVRDICLSSQHMLTGDLKGISRLKLGRGRLFYIATDKKVGEHEHGLAIVLHFAATRRAGDPKRDAYVEFKKLLDGNEFDLLFKKLGIPPPKSR